MAKTQLQHVVTAAAINLLRIAAWKNGTPIRQRAAPSSQPSNFKPREFATTVDVGFAPSSAEAHPCETLCFRGFEANPNLSSVYK
jgi:hypothetical protein